jgi:iron uptake system component EfeO
MLSRATQLSVALAAVLLSGCGGGQRPAPERRAPPLSARSALEKPFDARLLRTPIEHYRDWAGQRLALMQTDVARMRGRVAAGDLAGARRAWVQASADYGSVAAAYGAFGDLDAAINTTTAGLPAGENDPHFTGLHRVELALWRRHSLSDAAAPAARLQRDVRRLARALPKLTIDPAEFVLRAHEVIEGSLDLDLAGSAEGYSGHPIDTIAGEVTGATAVLGTLRRFVRLKSELDYRMAASSLRNLRLTLADLKRPDGYPALDALSQLDRERLQGALGLAAERLAAIPEDLDPVRRGPVQAPVQG